VKPTKKFKTINQVAMILKLPQHVLRFWENKFKQLEPLKLSGNRRYYRDIDIELIIYIKNLLREDCISIKGVQKIFGNSTINQILKNTNPILKKKNILSENKNFKNNHFEKNNTDYKKILKDLLIDLKNIKNSI
tara:strand:- start:11 stop:412 length:402 start_codon:yes stop_codon:yes gene_type:complete